MKANASKKKKLRVTKQAICDPIVLRETSRVRLVFAPRLVDDPANPNAKVDGFFAYERKLESGRWQDPGSSLAYLRADEGVKIQMSHVELLQLLEGLIPLYKFYVTAGSTALKAARSQAATLRGRVELPVGGEDDEDGSRAALLRVASWLATQRGRDAAAWLNLEAPEQIPALTAALGLAALRAAYDNWTKQQRNRSEEFWQETFRTRAHVLGQLFAYPVLVFGEKAYVGGKQINNKGGKYPDFALGAISTDSILLLEIKTPVTKLLGTQYRDGVFPVSGEIQGAAAQILRYRQTLMRTFDNLTAESEKRQTLGEPRCIILAGNSKELDTVAKKECFELQRERLNGITVVTFDELFGKLRELITLLSGEAPQDGFVA